MKGIVIGDSQINISWDVCQDPETGIHHYNIYRNNEKIKETLNVNYSDKGLVSNTAYQYYVTSVNNIGLESNKSSIISLKTDTTLPRTYGNSGIPGNGLQWNISYSHTTRIEAENFNQGGEGIGYRDTDSSNNGGKYRSENVDIEPCSESGYNIGWIDSGEWLEYTIDVKETGDYTLNLRIARETTGNSSLKVLFGPISQNLKDKTGNISVPCTNGWQNWQTIKSPIIHLEKGIQLMRILMTNKQMNINWIDINPVKPPKTYGNAGMPGNGMPWKIYLSQATRIEAENYNQGGEGIGYHDTNSSNTGSQYRNEDVDIGNCNEGNYNIGWIDAGEWLEYTIDVQESGDYRLNLRISREPSGSSSLKVLFGSNSQSLKEKIGNIAIPSTFGWDKWQTIKSPVIHLEKGVQIMRIHMLNNLFNLNWIEID
jgi:hypothetical protein